MVGKRNFWILDALVGPVYPEPWHVQNQKHIQNSGISEPRYIQNDGMF